MWCRARQDSQYGLPVCGCCQVVVREKAEGSNIHSKNVHTFEQRATGVILGMQMKLYQQYQWLNSITESKYWHRSVKKPFGCYYYHFNHIKIYTDDYCSLHSAQLLLLLGTWCEMVVIKLKCKKILNLRLNWWETVWYVPVFFHLFTT